jgi:hypothetical protein
MKVRPLLPDGLSMQELRVDTHSLQAFGEFMRRELDENVGPMAARVARVLMNGAITAGQLPSSDIEAMDAKHRLCADQMAQLLESYATKMAIIADAAKVIATRYVTSDELAKASVEGIAPAFASAIGADTPMQSDPADTPPPDFV